MNFTASFRILDDLLWFITTTDCRPNRTCSLWINFSDGRAWWSRRYCDPIFNAIRSSEVGNIDSIVNRKKWS